MDSCKRDALPRLNKDDAAMLLVDHQVGLFSLVRDSSPSNFKNIVVALAETAKLYQLPTVLTTSIEKGPNGVILPEIPRCCPRRHTSRDLGRSTRETMKILSRW